MGRQLPPHLKVQHSLPERFVGEPVLVNHYNTDRLIPSIPGFKTSAGMYGILRFPWRPRLAEHSKTIHVG